MQNTTGCIAEYEEKVDNNVLNRKQLHEVTTLAAEVKRLLVRHNAVLKEEGIRKEMRQLEEWLETERKGPAPAGVISASGIGWLIELRDKLKLSAEEAQRLEGEGGLPSSKEQVQKREDMMSAVRYIDDVIREHSAKLPLK